MILEQGESSKSSKDLEEHISKLSSKLAKNENKLSEIEKCADKLERSLEHM